MCPSSISGINFLSDSQKEEIYIKLIPKEIYQIFDLTSELIDDRGNKLFELKAEPDSSDMQFSLYHKHNFEDPIVYSHLTDTKNGQIHVLLFVMNDPSSTRFNVDRMQDGGKTIFGTKSRNLAAEEKALQAGLLPGQVRKGLKLLSEAQNNFEEFLSDLDHNRYFVQPLYYHNAIIFERYGFSYQTGHRRMLRIHEGFSNNGEFLSNLGSSPFRMDEAIDSIRLRSWAIHDGILGEPLDNITMYKKIEQPKQIDTAPGISW